jgi:hypothetical protein
MSRRISRITSPPPDVVREERASKDELGVPAVPQRGCSTIALNPPLLVRFSGAFAGRDLLEIIG